MKKKAMYFIVFVMLIISSMLIAYIYPFAKSEPVEENETISSNQSAEAEEQKRMVEFETENDLKKFTLLGGINSEQALIKYPNLGIAKEFSVFAEGDVTFTGADTEGKVAAGGAVRATTDYQYQIGIKNTNKISADIVVGNGPVENIALDYGYSDDGQNQLEDNKLIAYSSNAENMNLDQYNDDEKKHFIEADLIDFESEFERLREYSAQLASQPTTGYIRNDAGIIGNYKETQSRIEESYGIYNYFHTKNWYISKMLLLKGYNNDVNVFNLNSDIFTRYSGYGIALDVPYDSKVIINISGDNLKIDFGLDYNLYYPLSEEKLAELNIDNQRIGYVVNGQAYDNNAAVYSRDENNNIKPFIRVSGGLANEGGLEDISENILINIPNAENVDLRDCAGTVLAPNANVTTEYLSYFPNSSGYLLGNLICKSYNGFLQFGSKKYNTVKYMVNINKVGEQSNALKNAEFELFDCNQNKILEWKTDGLEKTIELDSGTYTLKETKAPENYDLMDDFSFTIDSYGYIFDSDGVKIGVANLVFNEQYEEKHYIDKVADWENEIPFPYTWDLLYSGLNVQPGNISKVSFEIDTSNATEYTDRDLYMVVAENNGRIQPAMGRILMDSNNWMEFIRYSKVNNGDIITTTVPVVKEVYPYYNTFDSDISIIKLKPHFYRQNFGEHATDSVEVSDIDVKNIKVYWKEVEKELKTKGIIATIKNNNLSTIDISNKLIRTNIRITKLDAKDESPLKGAKFSIYNKANDELLYTSNETDENGITIFENLLLNEGTYYVKETEAPHNYQISETKKEFVVSESSTIELVFENDLIYTEPEGEKENEDNQGNKEEQENKENKENIENQENKDISSPQTGDMILIAIVVLNLVSIGFGVTYVLKEIY